MSITQLESGNDPNYFTDEFLKFIEDNLGYFSKKDDLKTLNFEPAVGYKYEGDLYGLFRLLNVPNHLHYLTMRINGYDTPTDFKADRLSMLVYVGGNDRLIATALNTRTR